MSRLKWMLSAFSQESHLLLETNKDELGHFTQLISYLDKALKTSRCEKQLYKKVTKVAEPEQLLIYYKQNNAPLKKAINNYLTILICFESISKIYQPHTIKELFRPIFQIDFSAFQKFAILTQDNKLKFLPKEIIKALTIMKKKLRSKQRHFCLAPGEIHEEINAYYSLLKKYNLDDESLKAIKKMVSKKLEKILHCSVMQSKKNKPAPIDELLPWRDAVLEKNHSSTNSNRIQESFGVIAKPQQNAWNPFMFDFMSSWRGETENNSDANETSESFVTSISKGIS